MASSSVVESNPESLPTNGVILNPELRSIEVPSFS